MEVGPRRGKKDTPAVIFAYRRKLFLDLIRRQDIVGVQFLDIITLAEFVSMIYSCREAAVRCRNHLDAFGRKSARHLGGPIRGPIVYDDDFLALPGLRNRRSERKGEKFFGVISWN